MMRFNAVVIASILLFGGIAGCNQEESNEAVVSTPQVVPKRPQKPKAAAPNSTATASPTASPGVSPAASPKTGKTAVAPANTAKATAKTNDGAKPTLTKLNGYLPAAVKALQANDIAKAKQYAKGFSDNWQQKIIQFQVKNKSQSAYNKLASGVTQVTNTVIQPPNPDKAKAITSLQSLSQAVTEYTKSP
jgi:hypothetical protein